MTERELKTESGRSGRRHFLATGAMGVSQLALAWLLQRPVRAEAERPELGKKHYDLTPKTPQHEPRAKAMISLWMQGGPSHIDLFDPKPDMRRYDGKTFPGQIKYDNAAQASAKVFASPWKFRRHGESGIELSELLPGLAEIVDDITLIRSMKTGVSNHGQSIRAMNTGRVTAGRASLGSWMAYGLGTESQDLPAFVAMIDPGQLAVLGVENWSNGFLPSIYQGTVVRPREPRILNLHPPAHLQGAPQERALAHLKRLNSRHLAARPGNLDLDARIQSFELAARMQLAASEALDLRGESEVTKRLYGMDDPLTREYGSRCLVARRLVERGVRFVQVYTQNQFWDHHGSILKSLPAACKKTDRPSAALVQDLKARGLLDSTVVQWGGEMGRLPVIQNDAGRAKIGRDHNTNGFSMWLAGGGFRRGHVHGQTDDFGHKAVADVVTHHDYQATLLNVFGLEPERVVYKRNGREEVLTDGQEGSVVEAILADR